MFKSLKIPKKLGLSFILICVSAALMMVIFFSSITMIKSSTEGNNLSQAIHAKALTLETALLRQNSQFRGFLVTSDATYLKSYVEARDEYDSTSIALEKQLADPAQRSALLLSREATLEWRKKWADRLIGRVKAGQREAAQAEVRAAGKSVLTSAAVLPLREIRDAQVALIAMNSARQDGAIGTAVTVLIIGGIVLMGIAITLALLLSHIIARPISRLTKTMGDLAAGKNDIAVPDVERGDELGDMAKAVLIFRDAAITKQATDAAAAKAEADQKAVVLTVSHHLSLLANGNLGAEITADFPSNYAVVKTNFNDAVTALRELIASVMDSTASIRTGSGEIAHASEDLARRTEINAANLEETSAAVTQIDGRLKATAEAAIRTVARANGAMTAVTGGRSTADEAVEAMSRVSESAKGIDSVIEGLDKIAFQTRVLAMNAAVEAGRAGEAGRGFAVVADLVSALAMRAEEEAARARDQLSATQTDIVTAVDAVQKVDAALADISSGMGDVNELLDNIANDNRAQSSAITQISVAIGMMDQATQQNAAMVEETSAAARHLADEVDNLSQSASRFSVGADAGVAAVKFGGPAKVLPDAAITALRRRVPA